MILTQSPSKTIILTAGGTGGHLFPAISTSHMLIKMGHKVILFSDKRAKNYFNEEDMRLITISSATPSGGGFVSKIKSLFTIFYGVIESYIHFYKLKPDVIIGFGGYPTFPPIIAAKLAAIPIILHDQNMILGRANRVLLRFAKAIAVVHERVAAVPSGHEYKLHVTGNPLRENVLVAAQKSYPILDDESDIHLLIFGGSQGARILSNIVPSVITSLSSALQKRLKITQQARPEDVEKVKNIYQKAGIHADIASFFQDLPEKIAQSHLVIARSGAITVSELAAIGRPAIFIPLAASLDGDQAVNAHILTEVNAAWVVKENELEQDEFAHMITSLFQNKERLIHAAYMAKSKGIQDGAERLATLALRLDVDI